MCIGFLFILLFFIRTRFLILPFIRTYKIYYQCTNDKKKIALKIGRWAALCSSDIHSKTKYGQISCMALVSITLNLSRLTRVWLRARTGSRSDCKCAQKISVFAHELGQYFIYNSKIIYDLMVPLRLQLLNTVVWIVYARNLYFPMQYTSKIWYEKKQHVAWSCRRRRCIIGFYYC